MQFKGRNGSLRAQGVTRQVPALKRSYSIQGSTQIEVSSGAEDFENYFTKKSFNVNVGNPPKTIVAVFHAVM